MFCYREPLEPLFKSHIQTEWETYFEIPDNVCMPIWQIHVQKTTIWVSPAGNMFQRKIDEIFKDLPNVFDIADDILAVGYEADGNDHDDTLWRVLKTCRQVNLKLNKDKCHFRCTSIPLFGEILSRHGVKLDPQKLNSLTKIPSPKTKKELQAFLGIINYLSKFPPSTVSICESLRHLTLSNIPEAIQEGKINNKRRCMDKILWWDPTTIPRDRCIWRWTWSFPTSNQKCTSCPRDKAPDNSKLRPITFVSKSLSSAERRYSNIDREGTDSWNSITIALQESWV